MPVMKNSLILLILVSAFSCSKSINDPVVDFPGPDIPKTVDPPSQKEDNLVRDLGNGVVLRVSLFPNLVCDANDSSKLCNMFVSILYTLSQPIDRYVQVEVIKTNLVEKNKRTNAAADTTETLVTVMMVPNTTALTFNSTIQVSPNEKIASEEFRIGKVAIFQKAD
jgi:hypothetical protein